MTGQNSQRGRDREASGRTVSCSSGKFSYVSRAVAKEWARKARVGTMRPYRCTECGLWHVGHKPKAVIRGEVSSTEWYAGKGSARRRVRNAVDARRRENAEDSRDPQLRVAVQEPGSRDLTGEPGSADQELPSASCE